MKRLLLISFILLLFTFSFASASLTDDIMAYYKFDTDADDSIGSYDGTVSGATLTTGDGGIINEAYDFDGNNDYITSSGMATDSTYTICSWVRVEADSQGEITAGQGGSPARYGGMISYNVATNNLAFIAHNSDIGAVSGVDSITLNQWYFVCGIADDLTTRLYIDGVSISNSTSGNTKYFTSSRYIGRRDTGFYFNGKIDEFGIWNRTLTSNEIESLYNSGSGIQYPFSASSNNSEFTITAKDYYNDNSINNFSASIYNIDRCFQESANARGGSQGNDDCDYIEQYSSAYSTYTGTWAERLKLYDTSYSDNNGMSSLNLATHTIIYKKPSEAYQSSTIWRVADYTTETSVVYTNLTIPQDCWNYDSDYLLLYAYSNPDDDEYYWGCKYDSSNYLRLRNYTTTSLFKFVEEAIFWNTKNISSELNLSTTNGTINTGLYVNDTNNYHINIYSTNYLSSVFYPSYNVSSNLEGVLKQSQVNFILTSKISNTTIYNWTLEHEQDSNITTTGNLILYPTAKFYSDWNFTSLQGDYYNLYNQTFNITPLLNTTLTSQEAYNTILNITLNNAYSDESILSFNGWVYNNLYGFNETFNTTTGSAFVNLEQGLNYTVYIESDGYSITESNFENISINTTTENLNFELYSSNSVFVNIYDENTGLIVGGINMTIIVTGNASEDTYSTTTGSKFIENLTDGSYSFKITGGSYLLKTYEVVVADNSFQILNTYVSTNYSQTIFSILNTISGVSVEDALMSVERQINSSWTIVQSKSSDITGRIQFNYLPNVKYRFSVSKTGYTTRTFELDPIIFAEYNVKLTPLTSGGVNNNDFYNVNFYYSPKEYIEGLNNFTFSITSSEGILESYYYYIYYKEALINNGSGVNAYGETLTSVLNLSNPELSDFVKIILKYDTTISSEKEFVYTHDIIVSGYGNNTYIELIKNTDYGLGVFEKALITFFSVVFIAGVGFLVSGGVGSIIMGLLTYGVFIYLSFIPLWSVLPALFVGFFIIIWGANK